MIHIRDLKRVIRFEDSDHCTQSTIFAIVSA